MFQNLECGFPTQSFCFDGTELEVICDQALSIMSVTIWSAGRHGSKLQLHWCSYVVILV